MTSAPLRPALYANGTAPLFLDTAEITFTFEDGPPVTAQVQIARIDYARNTATIVFCESDREAIEALSLKRHFHTTVSIGELRAPKRAEEVTHDFEISHEMQITLHALSGDKREFDPYSQLEGLIAGPLKERRQMLRAEDAIRAFQKAPSLLARRTMLSRLAGFSDGQALTLLEGNRLAGARRKLLPQLRTCGQDASGCKPSRRSRAGLRMTDCVFRWTPPIPAIRGAARRKRSMSSCAIPAPAADPLSDKSQASIAREMPPSPS